MCESLHIHKPIDEIYYSFILGIDFESPCSALAGKLKKRNKDIHTERTSKEMSDWMNEWMNEWMNKINEWVIEWMN